MEIETKKGFWVSSSFTEKFGTKDVRPSKLVSPFRKLERSMTDSEIKKEFGIGECTLADVAAFLKNPPEGTDDGYTNIFYVAGCVVLVRWNSVSRKWNVGTWDLDGAYWSAGSRAFGRNIPSESPASSDALTLESLAARITKLEEITRHHKLGV